MGQIWIGPSDISPLPISIPLVATMFETTRTTQNSAKIMSKWEEPRLAKRTTSPVAVVARDDFVGMAKHYSIGAMLRCTRQIAARARQPRCLENQLLARGRILAKYVTDGKEFIRDMN